MKSFVSHMFFISLNRVPSLYATEDYGDGGCGSKKKIGEEKMNVGLAYCVLPYMDPSGFMTRTIIVDNRTRTQPIPSICISRCVCWRRATQQHIFRKTESENNVMEMIGKKERKSEWDKVSRSGWKTEIPQNKCSVICNANVARNYLTRAFRMWPNLWPTDWKYAFDVNECDATSCS